MVVAALRGAGRSATSLLVGGMLMLSFDDGRYVLALLCAKESCVTQTAGQLIGCARDMSHQTTDCSVDDDMRPGAGTGTCEWSSPDDKTSTPRHVPANTRTSGSNRSIYWRCLSVWRGVWSLDMTCGNEAYGDIDHLVWSCFGCVYSWVGMDA